jgi:hypothetical protein
MSSSKPPASTTSGSRARLSRSRSQPPRAWMPPVPPRTTSYVPIFPPSSVRPNVNGYVAHSPCLGRSSCGPAAESRPASRKSRISASLRQPSAPDRRSGGFGSPPNPNSWPDPAKSPPSHLPFTEPPRLRPLFRSSNFLGEASERELAPRLFRAYRGVCSPGSSESVSRTCREPSSS